MHASQHQTHLILSLALTHVAVRVGEVEVCELVDEPVVGGLDHDAVASVERLVRALAEREQRVELPDAVCRKRERAAHGKNTRGAAGIGKCE